MHTPRGMHIGHEVAHNDVGALVLTAAKTAHPNRFLNKPLTPAVLIAIVWIHAPRALTSPDVAQYTASTRCRVSIERFWRLSK